MTAPDERRADYLKKTADVRFSGLLVVLVAFLAGPPILLGFGLSAGWFDGLVSGLVLVGILSFCFERQQRIFAMLVGIPSVLFSTGGHAFSGALSNWVLFVGHSCQVLFFLGAAILIVKSIFGSHVLTLDSVAGAVCGYLFLGLAWAMSYSMIESIRPGSFEISPSLLTSGEPGGTPRQVLTYFSFVTLTTVGYGDVVPCSPTTRTCAWMEAVTGQFYLAVIVAGLVSVLVTSTRRSPTDEDNDPA